MGMRVGNSAWSPAPCCSRPPCIGGDSDSAHQPHPRADNLGLRPENGKGPAPGVAAGACRCRIACCAPSRRDVQLEGRPIISTLTGDEAPERSHHPRLLARARRQGPRRARSDSRRHRRLQRLLGACMAHAGGRGFVRRRTATPAGKSYAPQTLGAAAGMDLAATGRPGSLTDWPDVGLWPLMATIGWRARRTRTGWRATATS
jgi:hypothetical protein